MPTVSAADLAALRDQKGQFSRFYLGVLVPHTVHSSQINNAAIERGATTIAFDGGSYGTGYGAGYPTSIGIVAGMTLWVGTSADSYDICKLRVRDFTSGDGGVTGEFDVGEHDFEIEDDHYLTVKEEFRLWPRHPIGDPEGIIVNWYMDRNISYTGQNKDAQREPVVRMGSAAAARRDATTGQATVSFWSNSGAAPGGNAPSSYAWWWRKETGNWETAATAGTADSPHEVTWNGPGHFLARLGLDGTTYGYRPVLIFDPTGTSAAYEDFEISDISGDFDAGGWRASFTVKEDCAVADFPEESIVIVFAEDYYKGTQVSIGGNYRHRENNVFVGYITAGTVRKDPFTNDVTFEAHTVDGEMRNCELFPHSLEDGPSADNNWLQIQNMTMDKGVYHILRWGSTLLDITDIHFSGDTKPLRWLDVTQKSLYEQINDDCYSALMGRVLSDRMGIVQFEINPQFLDTNAARDAIDTIMEVEAQDWRDEISLPNPQTPSCSLVDLSGVSYAGDHADVEPVFSLAHGDAPIERGRSTDVENLLLESQIQANRVAGNYIANQNNPYPRISVPITNNYRIFDIVPQEWVTLSLAAGETYRGVTWSSDRFIPRIIRFNINNSMGVLNADLELEKETTGTAGIAGYYPEEIVEPPTPPRPPVPECPPGTYWNGIECVAITEEGDGRTMYVCTDKGIARCDDITQGAAATWTAINSGLGADLVVYSFRFDPSWSPGNKRGVCSTANNVYRGDHLDGIGGTPTWTNILTLAEARTACGAAGVDGFCGPRTWAEAGREAGFLVTSSIFEANYIGVFAFDHSGAQNVQHYYLHSHDRGGSWSCSALPAPGRLIVPRYSNHTYNRVHVIHFLGSGANPDFGAHDVSADGGHIWSRQNFNNADDAGGTDLRDWGIPYRQNDGSLNSDETHSWVANVSTGVDAVRRSTTGINVDHTDVGDAGMDWGNRLAGSTQNPEYRAMMESRRAGSNAHIWITDDWAVSWTDAWNIADDYYPVCISGFPYSGAYLYWGAYRANATAVYLWYTRDTFVSTHAFQGNLATVLGLASGDKLHVMVPDWTAT